MELIEPLINLGLSEKEAKTYLALLPFRKATAYLVSTRSGIKKPTTYVILENLVAKGFALKLPQDGKYFYSAKSPKECVAIAREKISSAEEALPQLLAIQKENSEKVNISYFEGFDEIKKLYEDIIRNMQQKPETERNFVGFFAHAKDTPPILQEYWDELNKEYFKNKIKGQGITTLHETTEKYLREEISEKYQVSIKALSEEIYSSNISVEIYGDLTLIVSHRYLQGILIENPDISNVMKQIFGLVWNSENQTKSKNNQIKL